jgi:hypothetical protein
MPLRDVLGLTVTHIHSVWGYVALTGVAAAVPLGFDPPKAVATHPAGASLTLRSRLAYDKTEVR